MRVLGILAISLFSLAAATGCRTTVRTDGLTEREAELLGEPPPPPPAEADPEPEAPSPEEAAASALVAKARRLIKRGRLDAALSQLERASSINPRSGEGHYWLAEVWLAKGDKDQAAEHHRLARRYLSGQAQWAKPLSRQGKSL